MTVQELFVKHGLQQRDLTRALRKYNPPISRTFAHYVWHGAKPPTLNVVMAIRKEFPDIPAEDLFEVLKTTRP
jgi:hypothetical protein